MMGRLLPRKAGPANTNWRIWRWVSGQVLAAKAQIQCLCSHTLRAAPLSAPFLPCGCASVSESFQKVPHPGPAIAGVISGHPISQPGFCSGMPLGQGVRPSKFPDSTLARHWCGKAPGAAEAKFACLAQGGWLEVNFQGTTFPGGSLQFPAPSACCRGTDSASGFRHCACGRHRRVCAFLAYPHARLQHSGAASPAECSSLGLEGTTFGCPHAQTTLRSTRRPPSHADCSSFDPKETPIDSRAHKGPIHSWLHPGTTLSWKAPLQERPSIHPIHFRNDLQHLRPTFRTPSGARF